MGNEKKDGSKDNGKGKLKEAVKTRLRNKIGGRGD